MEIKKTTTFGIVNIQKMKLERMTTIDSKIWEVQCDRQLNLCATNRCMTTAWGCFYNSS